MKNFPEEKIPSESTKEKLPDNFIELVSFIEKEYFVNFLDKLDQSGNENIFAGIKEKTGVDVLAMKEYINHRIPLLLEKIKEISKDGQMQVAADNSFRDILSNSIIMVFKKIVWLTENFNTEDPKDKKRIDNPNSAARKVIASFSEEAARYYIDKLCQNVEKLELELSTTEGWLKRAEEYFKINPTGSKKAIYFRFFSELENCTDLAKLTKEIELVKNFEDKSGIEILDREKVVSDFSKGAFIF